MTDPTFPTVEKFEELRNILIELLKCNSEQDYRATARILEAYIQKQLEELSGTRPEQPDNWF